MKKSFIYIAMAAMALSSCSKNEVYETATDGISDPNKISFNSTTGTTRAVSNDLAALKGSEGFNVLGFEKDQTSAFIPGKDNEGTYKFTTPNWGWVAQEYTWPEDQTKYPVTFYAEYPKVADMSANTSLNKAITMDLAVANQVDHLVAKTVVTDRPTNGFAALNFKHILSNLVFKIETKDNYKVYIQSIRVVNTANKGRTFDYATMAYEGTEPTYQTTDYATTDGTYNESEGFFYFKHSTTPWNFTGAIGTLVGTVPTEATDHIMMQMPQMTIPYWVNKSGKALETFMTDAAAWKAGNATGTTKLDAWYNAATGASDQPGMSDSNGWKGARIEVIYRIEDVTNSGSPVSIIGRKNGETYTKADGSTDTAGKDYFIRVGYPLDLSEIKVSTVSKGWEMNKRYTYTIQMGTAKATNGILLNPDYKKIDGSSDNPKVPVDNPKVDPGNPVTPGTINFIVDVDDWVDNNTDIPVN